MAPAEETKANSKGKSPKGVKKSAAAEKTCKKEKAKAEGEEVALPPKVHRSSFIRGAVRAMPKIAKGPGCVGRLQPAEACYRAIADIWIKRALSKVNSNIEKSDKHSPASLRKHINAELTRVGPLARPNAET